MRPLALRPGSPWCRATAVATVVALAVALLPFQAAPAAAAPVLTVSTITFDVIGLDSNAPTAGPSVFPVGARACNTGDAPVTNATATLVFEAPINTYIAAQGPTVVNVGTIAAGACRDAYFNVVVQQVSAAFDTVQRYYVQFATDQGISATTSRPRQLYVEHLVSQNRNDVVSLTGPSNVYVGQTYDYVLVAKTATQGYEQLESFVTLDNVIFQVVATRAEYSSPVGGTNDKLWADACGFQLNPLLPNYKTCVGPVQYAGGKAGGDVKITYSLKVLSTGTTTFSALIYDFSGSSFHYNSDFSDPITSLQINALPESADLAVTKTASTTTPSVGEDVTFTVGLANAGPSPATAVTVRDLLPAGLTYLSSVAPAGTTYDPVTGDWAVPSLAASGATSLSVTARVTAGGAITNVAEVVASGVADPDSTPGNGSTTEDDRAAVTLTPPSADLSVVKTVSTSTPNVGENVTFTVQVVNSGPATPATNVVVRDLLPPGLAFVSASTASGTYDPVTGTWTVGSVAVGAPRTLTVVATVTGTGPITNTAQVQSVDQLDPDSSPGNANPTEDDQSSVTISAQVSDLSLSKTVDDASPNVGQNVTFTVRLANAGPDAATNLTVADPLPAGLTFVSAAPSQGSYNSATGAWFVGIVGSGGTATLTLTATTTGTTAVTNTAQVQSVDQRDPDSSPGNSVGTEDDQASVVVTPRQADLSLTKAVDIAQPNVGQDVTFTISVTNAATSNSAATGVVVRDLLPAGLTFGSATGGTYDPATGDWTIATIAPGATATLRIVAEVTGATAMVNTASVHRVDQFDPDSTPGNGAPGEDDQASVTVTPQRADLSLTKSVSVNRPNVGDTVTYTVTIANAGPDGASGVSVLDQLPAGLALLTATATQGTYDGASGMWTVGSVPAAGSAALVIEAQVTSASETSNIASVATSDQFDPDSTPGNSVDEDDQAAAVATPQQADLSVTNVVDAAGVDVGGQATFTVSVTNTGPDAGTGVVVTDQLPAGLTFVSATTSSGAYDAGTGEWSVGNVAAGATATLVLVARVDQPGSLQTVAEVTAVDQFDPDSTPANADPDEDDRAAATVTGLQADLSLTAAVDVVRPNVGDTVTFTFTVSDAGPDDATGVAVIAALPAGYQFVSSQAATGAYTAATGVWTIGTITAGGSVTLTVTAIVTSAQPGTVIAEVVSSDRSDPDSTPGNGVEGEDDQAAVAVQPLVADLAVTLAVDEERPNVGDTVTFTATVTNDGPDGGSSVVVAVPLPSGLAFVSGPSAYDGATGLWSVGALAPGATSTITVVATVTSAAPAVVGAEVSAVDQFDPDSTPGNGAFGEDDLALVALTPQSADLSVSQTVSRSEANVGEQVTFTVTLANAGPDAATGIVVADPLPAGLVYVSSVVAPGTSYDPATGRWTVASLAAGESISLAVTVQVAAAGAQTSTASVAEVDQFDVDSTPGNLAAEDDLAAVVVTGLAADLAVTVDGPATATAASPVTYTIVVTNDGPATAVDAIVDGPVPADLAGAATTTPGCAVAAGRLTCAFGDLLAGETRTIVLIGTAPAAGAVTVTVDATSSTPDLDPADNQDSVTTTIVGQADLRLAKTAPATVDAGDALTYDLIVTNDGPSTAGDLVVTDVLPEGLGSPTTSSPGCSLGGPDGRTLTCSTTTLAMGASVTFSVSGVAPAGGTLDNTATVDTSTIDPDPTDDESSVSTSVTPQADLFLLKGGPSTVDAGGAITYVIAVANGGPSSAQDVVITDELPAELASPSTSSPGCVLGGAGGRTLTCTLASLASGDTWSVSVSGTAPASGTLDTLANTATVSSATADPDPTDNSSTAASSIRPSVAVADASISEGGTLAFTVTLSNPSMEDVVVDLATNDGTALSPGDFTARSVTVTIPAGSTVGTFTVPTAGDLIDEPDETLAATIVAAEGAFVADDLATGTITDDDPTPTVSVEDVVVTEGDMATFTLVLSNPSSVPVTVDVASASGSAVSGTDFTGTSGTVTFTPGETTATVTVQTTEDVVDESNETFSIELSNPSGATTPDTEAVATITDDDGVPTVSVADIVVLEGDVATFTLVLSNPSSLPVTVDVATASGSAVAGTDFTGRSVTVTFAPGETVATVTVQTTEDPIDEAAETFSIVLSNPSGLAIPDPEAVATITDDDGVPTVSVGDVVVTEGGDVIFTVTLSNPSAQDVTVDVTTADGSATAPGDYGSVTRTVTIPAGETSAPVAVPTIADGVDELDETFTVRLAAPTGAAIGDDVATGTIVDPDNSVTAVDDSVTTDEDVPLSFDPTTNDADVDGDAFEIVSVTQPPAGQGSVVLNPDGTLTFLPAAGVHGTVTFTYTLEDAAGATDTATVTVTVAPVNDPPVGTPDAYAVAPGTPLIVAGPGVLGNDTDTDGDPLTVALASPPTAGTVALRPDGSFEYVPAPGFSGPVTFTYTVSDGSSAAGPVTVTLTVAPAPDPPVAADDSASTDEAGVVVLPVLSNDVDGDGPVVGTVTIVAAPSKGTATVQPDGSIRYQAAPGAAGTDTLIYRVCNAEGLCDEAEVTITVEGPALVLPPELPRTGAPLAGLAGIGVVLLLCGTALAGVGGRRRPGSSLGSADGGFVR